MGPPQALDHKDGPNSDPISPNFLGHPVAKMTILGLKDGHVSELSKSLGPWGIHAIHCKPPSHTHGDQKWHAARDARGARS